MGAQRLDDFMKIIFLDIDGVLNSTESMKRNLSFGRFADLPDEKLVFNLNKIGEEFGNDLKIVISSTWRLGSKLSDLNRMLFQSGVKIEAISMTPILHISRVPRGREIKKWLEEHKNLEIKSFVILDDDSDMGDLKKYLVKTDPNVGLTIDDAKKAIKILKGD